MVDTCKNPIQFLEKAVVPDLLQDNYSGFALRFEFDEFDIIPDQCEVTYACTSV